MGEREWGVGVGRAERREGWERECRRRREVRREGWEKSGKKCITFVPRTNTTSLSHVQIKKCKEHNFVRPLVRAITALE